MHGVLGRGMQLTLRPRAVTVKQLPAAFDSKQEQIFLREFEDCLNVSRPCIVLDCSQACEIDGPFLHLLLCCLEEAMKRNGDVRLAALTPEAKAALKVSRIERLFKTYETETEAVDSFQQPSGYVACGDDGYSQPAESAA